QENLDEKLKELEQSEKNLLAAIEQSKSKPYQNKEVIPDLSSSDSSFDTSSSSANLSQSDSPASMFDVSQNDLVGDIETSSTRSSDSAEIAKSDSMKGLNKDSGSSSDGFKELTSQDSSLTSRISVVGMKNVEDQNHSRVQTQAVAGDAELGVQNQGAQDNQNNDLDSLRKELAKKDHQISLLKASEASLNAKIKLYEEELKKLNGKVEELNRMLLARSQGSYSRAVSTVETSFRRDGLQNSYNDIAMPKQVVPDKPVPLIEVSAGTVVYSGPSFSSSPLLSINETTRVPKIDSVSNWTRIIAPNGVKGWIFREGPGTSSVRSSVEERALENWVMIGR
ncbi:MAG: hypothetical protein NZO16_06935, partial [Deltaproteobacteria bacterium]|nr:hypothetical protein [Deltaproteobacteria bacterium]